MNTPFLKKYQPFFFKDYIINKEYTNLLNTKDHIDLRKELVKHNLTIKVIKNSVFFNAVNLTNLKNLRREVKNIR